MGFFRDSRTFSSLVTRNLSLLTLFIVLSACSPITLPETDLSCKNYCEGIQSVCTAQNFSEQYRSESDCLEHCSALDKGTLFVAGVGDTSVNTVACRIYHTGLAQQAINDSLEPVEVKKHCVHAGTTGGELCGTLCDNYCALMKSNCDLQPDVACSTTCKAAMNGVDGFIEGEVGDLNGDTIQCRIHYASQAGIGEGKTVEADNEKNCVNASLDYGIDDVELSSFCVSPKSD